jgi:hypothetical protein
MLSFRGITLPDMRALGNRRLIAIAAIAGAACSALLLAFVTQPNVQTANAQTAIEADMAGMALVGSAPFPARAELACEPQHWPYVDRRCLSDADAKHPARMVRMVKMDKTDRMASAPDVPGPATADTESAAAMDADDTQAAIRAAGSGTATQPSDMLATTDHTDHIRAAAAEQRPQRKVARTQRVRVVVMHDPASSDPRRTDRSRTLRWSTATAHAPSGVAGGGFAASGRVIMIQGGNRSPRAYDPNAYAYSPPN